MNVRRCWTGAPLLVVLAIGCHGGPPPAAPLAPEKVAGTVRAESEKNVKKTKVIGRPLGPIGVVD